MSCTCVRTFDSKMMQEELGWEYEVPLSQGTNEASSVAGSPKKKRGKTGGVKKKTKQKAKIDRGKAGSKKCFVCDLQKKANSKFCKDHNPMYESIRLQAHNKGEMQAFIEVFACEAKARAALLQWVKDNPPGKRFRKKLIDFHQWRRDYGVRISFVQRDNEIEMDETDFVVYQTESRKKEKSWAHQEWKRLIDDPKVDTSGEGVNKKIWVTLPKTRERVRENFEQNQLSEASKDLKELNDGDVNILKEFAHSSAASQSSAFLNSKIAEKTLTSEPQIEEGSSRKRKISVAMAAPAASSKYKKFIEFFTNSLNTIKDLMDKAHSEYADYELAVRDQQGCPVGDVGELKAIPAEVSAYNRALAINSELYKLFFATEVIDSTLDLAESPVVAKAACSPSKGGSLGAGASSSSNASLAAKSSPAKSPSKASSELSQEDGTEQTHQSKDSVTLHFVATLKSLPPKYLPSKELVKFYSWEEMKWIVGRMPHAETIEELDDLKTNWEHGYASALLLRDQFREAAKQMSSAIQNEIRAGRRKEQQDNSRTRYRNSIFISLTVCILFS